MGSSTDGHVSTTITCNYMYVIMAPPNEHKLEVPFLEKRGWCVVNACAIFDQMYIDIYKNNNFICIYYI